MTETRRAAPRASSRGASTRAKSAESQDAAVPRVIGGLLRGQPELAVLAKAAAGLARLEFVDDRFGLVSAVVTSRPRALVLPPFDADHTSTAPLVLRVRREAPGVPVLVLSLNPGGAGQPMLRSAQAGAHVLTSPTPAELHAALRELLEWRETRDADPGVRVGG